MNHARLSMLLAGAFAAASLVSQAPPQTAAAQPPPKAKAASKRILLDRIVAVVNNSIILQSDLQTRLSPCERRGGRQRRHEALGGHARAGARRHGQ
ncbi:MAG: hypothetical protein IPL79_06890 [Myxococcales bacterium]|nr:hypothetical protein [Myxococcales bacterium]